MSTLLQYGDPVAAGVDAVRLGRARQVAAGCVTEEVTPALVVLAARRGVVFLHEAFGRLMPEAGSPVVRADTIYPVASINKPVTATAVLCLVEDGLLELDRSVQKYIAEFTGDGKEAVTVRHLLTHTSGLRDEAVYAHVGRKREAGPNPPDERTEPASLALFPPYVMYWHFESGLDTPLSGGTGHEVVYSSYGYALLGEIIQRVSGRSFADFCRERIFARLGMRDSYFEVPEVEWPRVVRRPTRFGLLHLNVRERIPVAMPQGGLSSTAWDLAVFGQAFLNSGSYGGVRTLTPASVAQMTRDQVPGVPPQRQGEPLAKASHGLGWFLNLPGEVYPFPSQLSDEAFGHGGSGGSLLCVDPARELVVVWLSVWPDMSTTSQYGFVDALIESVVD